MTDLPHTSWHVHRIEEDAQQVKVTLQRSSWATPDEPEYPESTSWTDAAPGEPGSVWVPDGIFTTLTYDSDASGTFSIGQHFVLGLTEVNDAVSMEA